MSNNFDLFENALQKCNVTNQGLEKKNLVIFSANI